MLENQHNTDGIKIKMMRTHCNRNPTAMLFIGEWCDNCSKEMRCPILTKSLLGDEVSQWQYVDNKPTCIAFKKIGTKNKKSIKTYINQKKLFND